MTEETQKPQIYSHDEIHEMFNTAFLPKLQQFAQRTKKEMYADKEIAFFQVRMVLKFSDLESPLTYDSIKKDDINLQLQPVLQEDIDKAKAEAEEKAKQDASKDTGDE